MDFRQVAAIAGVVVMVPMGIRAEAAEPPVTMAVRTYNYFGVPARDLEAARTQATAILREAGIDVSWLDCNVPNEAPQCNQPVGSTDVILRIGAAHETSGHQFTSMGFSLVNLSDGKAPYLSTIYADLVASVARGAGIDASELLGRAIAHEIGHLMLGTNQHAASGLMRALWSRAELRRSNASDWHFLASEVSAMHTAVAMRHSASGN